jgi:hypothetical protein
MFESEVVELAGASYGGAQENIRQWGCEYIATYELVREPFNPFDSNAIKVAVIGQVFLGYVPRYLARILAPMMDAGRRFIAEFVSVNKYPYRNSVGLTVRIVEKVPAQ